MAFNFIFMNKRLTTIIFLCSYILLGYTNTNANPDSISISKHFAVKVGVYNLASIDNIYSPFIYSGKSFVLGMGWGKEKKGRSFETDLSFSNIQRKATSLEGIPNSYEDGHYHIVRNSFVLEVMDYYRFLITDMEQKKLQIFFSGLWFTTVNLTTNASGVPELIQSGIAPGIFVRYKAGRHRLRAELHLPIVAWTVRNNYSMSSAQIYEKLSKFDFILQNSMLQTPISNPGIYTNFAYEYFLAKKFSIKANYSFKYIYNSKPQTLKSVSGIYSVSLIFNR